MKKNVFAIIGSTRNNSFNQKIVEQIKEMIPNDVSIFSTYRIDELPHFNPDFDNDNLPVEVSEFRKLIAEADGVLICTPEYVFSLPGSLKNAMEWCVSSTVFSSKPVGLITASTSGKKAHEELIMIMKTLGAIFNDNSTVLIQGVQAKFDENKKITNPETLKQLQRFINEFNKLMNE